MVRNNYIFLVVYSSINIVYSLKSLTVQVSEKVISRNMLKD